jgi:hypothetical protein
MVLRFNSLPKLLGVKRAIVGPTHSFHVLGCCNVLCILATVYATQINTITATMRNIKDNANKNGCGKLFHLLFFKWFVLLV